MLLLFDIDGTLISTGEAGTRALSRAFEELFGIKDAFKKIEMAGKTDPQIMREGLRTHGIADTDENLKAMIETYLRFLVIEIENPWRRIKPGVKEMLEHFDSMGFPMGLLTGNLEKGARIKLEPFGLNHYFPTGAFGSDHEDRNCLLPIALERFSSNGCVLSADRTVVIGDTPKDVECARVHGAYAVAVATGPYPPDVLKETGAHLVLNTLEEMDALMNFIDSVSS